MVDRYLVDFDLNKIPKKYCDCLVIGSGIAGLYTALKVSSWANVILLTKEKLADSNTEQAQGGIAAAISQKDSPVFHLEDTIVAGAGLCDTNAVEVLVTEGPDCVHELISFGTNFDRKDGDLALTREGAHSRRRILHAHGDATGEEIHRSLVSQVKREGMVSLIEDTFVVDLLTCDGICYGVIATDRESGRLIAYLSKATVLATGGAGQLYRNTTNPDVATGDGIAIAYRAGAEIMDIEFIQFHPTALDQPGAPHFLISEAVRGEGALLRNCFGERFMPNYHEKAELAPRDIVARAIVTEMNRTDSSKVYLDVRHLESDVVKKRFPNIYSNCLSYGIDITQELIPVSPSAHYIMGGVRTDLNGKTNITGLFACGEAACNAVHGANRLASNSLLDGLVFGRRISNTINGYFDSMEKGFSFDNIFSSMSSEAAGTFESQDEIELVNSLREKLQRLTWRYAGMVRNLSGLQKAMNEIEGLEKQLKESLYTKEGWEFKNMLLLAKLVLKAASIRHESRGAHYLEDYPQSDEINWHKHIIFTKDIDYRLAGKEEGYRFEM